jgi:hypothetical protein
LQHGRKTKTEADLERTFYLHSPFAKAKQQQRELEKGPELKRDENAWWVDIVLP